MTTGVVLERGSDWSRATLADGWGPDTTDEQVDEQCGNVIDRFESRCQEKGIYAYWFPDLSEVIGDIGQDIPYGLLEQLRDEVIGVVWEEFVGWPQLTAMTRTLHDIVEDARSDLRQWADENPDDWDPDRFIFDTSLCATPVNSRDLARLAVDNPAFRPPHFAKFVAAQVSSYLCAELQKEWSEIVCDREDNIDPAEYEGPVE